MNYYLIAIISSFFTLYCIEGYLIFKKYNLDPKIRNQKLAKSEGKNFDTRNKYEVYKDHKIKTNRCCSIFTPSSTWTKQMDLIIKMKIYFLYQVFQKK